MLTNTEMRELVVNVTVVDVNDNSPVFPAEQNLASVPIPSNFPIGSTVFTIIVSVPFTCTL